MVNFGDDGRFQGPIAPSCLFFKEMGCLIGDNDVDDSDVDSEMVDEEKMRCLILDGLVALRKVQRDKKEKIKDKIDNTYDQHESAKSRVFASAISMILDDNESLDADPALANLLVPFPDQKKKTDGRTWLPLHFALALGDEVKEDDVRLLYSQDPIVMQKHHLESIPNSIKPGFSPGHLLCMQIKPNMSLMRYLSMRNRKAFTMSVSCSKSYNGGRNALQLATEYSESVDLVNNLLQIDKSMTKRSKKLHYDRSNTGLGFLCGRSRFTSFNEIYECLIAANNSVEVVSDGLVSLFRFYRESDNADGQIQVVLAQVESLLKANSSLKSCNNDTVIVFRACQYLKGKLGVAILSLLLTEYSDGVGAGLRLPDVKGRLPVHTAARNSTVDVVELLLKVWPESCNEIDTVENNLFHCALMDSNQDRAIVKVQYLCNHYPDLLRNSQIQGLTPLMCHLCLADREINLTVMTIMCEADATIVTEKCKSPGWNQMLPLNMLAKHRTFSSLGVTVFADCFRYLLRLYPAAAGIKNAREESVYDIAVANYADIYFIRLLLNADLTVEPERRRDLNFAARKQVRP